MKLQLYQAVRDNGHQSQPIQSQQQADPLDTERFRELDKTDPDLKVIQVSPDWQNLYA